MRYYRVMFGKRRIYMDSASSTPIDPRVARAVARSLTEFQGNPSAPHEEGRTARTAVELARSAAASSLAVKPQELLFTSGGTESNNIALRGLAEALHERGAAYKDMHVITTAIEHSSVLKAVAALERDGVAVSYAMPGKDGIVPQEAIAELVRPETILVTVAHVNSEIGTIQPVRDIAAAARTAGRGGSVFSRLSPETIFPVIHADAAQSPLYLDAGPHVLGADLVSYDAQKVGGPKGSGILYRDFSVPLAPLYGGGTQERGIRPGTENVSGIVGAALAFSLAKEGRAERAERVARVRDRLISLVKEAVPEARLTGHARKRIANNAHFVIPGVSGDYLAVLMDKEDIAVSPRSACIGSAETSSHVVLAVTGSDADASATIRFSLSPDTTLRDCARAAAALKRAVPIARAGK